MLPRFLSTRGILICSELELYLSSLYTLFLLAILSCAGLSYSEMCTCLTTGAAGSAVKPSEVPMRIMVWYSESSSIWGLGCYGSESALLLFCRFGLCFSSGDRLGLPPSDTIVSLLACSCFALMKSFSVVLKIARLPERFSTGLSNCRRGVGVTDSA